MLSTFAAGDENFERVFTVEEGLGPLFNEPSCGTCHPGDGRGTPSTALTRFSRGHDLIVTEGGPQLQTRAIPGFAPEELPDGVDSSRRLPPPVFGVGLIEAIPVETILANVDVNDADGDGVSGRAHWVIPPDFVPEWQVGGGDGLQLGRFSRKAQVSSLLEQVVGAYNEDMGITSDFRVDEAGSFQTGQAVTGDTVADPEISAAEVETTITYVRLLAPPARGPITRSVRAGEQHFEALGCASCHVPTMRTGPNVIAALDEVDVNLYSDLLLHDMGPELADGRPDGDASGSEWKTPPLWGLRLAPGFLGGQAFYLHDGRTSDLAEAISLHGGEAQAARDAFAALTRAEKAELIDFLLSI